MSRIEYQKIQPQLLSISLEELSFNNSSRNDCVLLPQIYWSNNTRWDVANIYAYDLFINERLKIKTIQTDIMHLKAYASWLESQNDIDWLTFPKRKSDRCIFIFRGELIKQRESKALSPSTATHRMRSVIKFYRWVLGNNLIKQETELWQDKKLKVTAFNKFGFEHTFDVMTTDLAIPLRTNNSNIDLEDGISPINPKHASSILDYAKNNAPIEIYLMLKIGFYTGMRIGSITDLKVQTIENFAYLQNMSMGTIRIGTQANPQVRTKFSKTGNIIIPTELRDELLEYAYSVKRLKRISNSEYSDHLFLTARGNKYLDDNNQSINVAIHRLRKRALTEGIYEFKGFHFHRTRATFATVLMQYCLNKMDVSSAISLVKDCCMHKDEQTTLKYVKFIHTHEKLSNLSNEYTKMFLGLKHDNL